MTSLLMDACDSKRHETHSWRYSLRVLVATLVWGAAGAAQAAPPPICEEGTFIECSTSDGCTGYAYCDGIRYGKCDTSSTCEPTPPPPPQPPLTVSFQTSGIGTNREKGVQDTGTSNTVDEIYPTQLFTRAQRHIVFTASATSSSTRLTSVKLVGALKTTCTKLRETPSDPEQRREKVDPLFSETTSAQSQFNLSTALSVDFSPVVHPTCDDGFLPWKQEVTLHAEATNSTGQKAYSYRAKFVFNHSFKVATYNIQQGQLTRGRDTIDHLARHMNRNEVDVVLMQETNYNSSTRLASSPDIGVLKVYRAGASYPNPEDLAVVTRFPFKANATYRHSDTLSGYDYVWQFVKLAMGDLQINVANVHLVADSVASERWLNGADVRRRSVQDVMNYLDPYTTVPTIFAGDFNTDVYTNTGTLNNQLQPLYNAPGYVHFCWANPCAVYPDNAERFNVDQIWFTQNTTPALQVIDGYRALTSEGEEPSDHTMRVSRMVLVEAP